MHANVVAHEYISQGEIVGDGVPGDIRQRVLDCDVACRASDDHRELRLPIDAAAVGRQRNAFPGTHDHRARRRLDEMPRRSRNRMRIGRRWHIERAVHLRDVIIVIRARAVDGSR